MAEVINKDVNITYETLFELLRREKSREDLQELQESFFEDVVEYLRDKTRIMETSKSKLFSEEEKEKTMEQIRNIRKMLRELYERREKKIINMALNKSRTKTALINTSVLLEEEKSLYDSLNSILDRYRECVLMNMLSNKAPEIRREALSAKDEQPGSETNSGQEKPKELKMEAFPSKKTKTIRFLKPIPKFVGPDLIVYGPFEEEDIARLPEAAADVLIAKERAEAMESGMESENNT